MNNQLAIAFLLGLGSRLHVRLIGYLSLSEIAILLATPFLLPRYTSVRSRLTSGWLLPLAAAWAVSTIVADIVNHNSLPLFARGISRPIFYFVCIAFYVPFFTTDLKRKLTAIYIGMIPSIVLSAFVLKSGAAAGRELVTGSADIRWETHWAAIPGALAAVAALAFYERRPAIAYAANIGLGLVNISQGARSAGAVNLLGPAVCYIRNITSSRSARSPTRRLLFFGTITAVSLTIAAVILTYFTYSTMAESGLLSKAATEKYERQTKGGLNILIAARPEVLVGLFAVWDSPFFGHGSWAKDVDARFLRAASDYLGVQYDMKAFYRSYQGIRTHSHLVQAWAENGLLGAVFWIYALWFVGRSIARPMHSEASVRLWASCAATSLAWAILFSPISERNMESLVLSALAVSTMPSTARRESVP